MFQAKKTFYSIILKLGLENCQSAASDHKHKPAFKCCCLVDRSMWRAAALTAHLSLSAWILKLFLQTFCAPSSLWEVWRSSVMVDAEMLFLLSASCCLSLTSVGFSVRFINTSVSSSLSLSVLTRHVPACPLVVRGLQPPRCEGTDLTCTTPFTVYLLHDERRHCHHFKHILKWNSQQNAPKFFCFVNVHESNIHVKA